MFSHYSRLGIDFSYIEFLQLLVQVKKNIDG